MTDEAQAGRAKRYAEMLEKFPHWTFADLSDIPDTQFAAVFGAKDDVEVDSSPGALARAMEAARQRQREEKEKGG